MPTLVCASKLILVTVERLIVGGPSHFAFTFLHFWHFVHFYSQEKCGEFICGLREINYILVSPDGAAEGRKLIYLIVLGRGFRQQLYLSYFSVVGWSGCREQNMFYSKGHHHGAIYLRWHSCGRHLNLLQRADETQTGRNSFPHIPVLSASAVLCLENSIFFTLYQPCRNLFPGGEVLPYKFFGIFVLNRVSIFITLF